VTEALESDLTIVFCLPTVKGIHLGRAEEDKMSCGHFDKGDILRSSVSYRRKWKRFEQSSHRDEQSRAH
jgi:hypothetical protein